MSQNDNLQPEEIKLHQKSRLLTIRFPDGKTFHLPCEYLRVCSPAAEVVASDLPEAGKEKVNIVNLEPQGTYALRIEFDDGHDTGIYSWERLYDLGVNQEKYWQDYLDKLKAHGLDRGDSEDQGDKAETLSVKIMYFNYLVNKLGIQEESVSLPASRVKTVQDLLKALAIRKLERGYLLDQEHVRVTVNRQFAEPFTLLENGDEVGIVPNSPNPPAPPKT
ncbi:MAG TPA: DUF971 domain-containing protein [Chromatiaceae bacterium]|nr:DUF971 domain-containing protein [Chromatiaceae bacterium]